MDNFNNKTIEGAEMKSRLMIESNIVVELLLLSISQACFSNNMLDLLSFFQKMKGQKWDKKVEFATFAGALAVKLVQYYEKDV